MPEPQRAQRKTPYTAVNLPVTVRDELNLMSLELSVRLGRRVSMAALVGAALTLANDHQGELAEIVSDRGRSTKHAT